MAAFEDRADVSTAEADGLHEFCFAFSMDDEAKTAIELVAMIKEQAILSLGPWPDDLQLMIFGRGSRWSCGLSPTTRTSDAAYREGVLQIARALQKAVSHKPRR
jgi:hypothetical protein